MTDKLYVKQWTIGIAKGNLDDVLENRLNKLDFKWLPLPNPETFIADPFVIELPSGEIHLLAEHIQQPYFGKLVAYKFSKELDLLEEKIILDTGKHLSYPFILEENGQIFIIPESAMAYGVFAYPYDPIGMKLEEPVTLIPDTPLLDSTLIFHNEKWWLFATKKGISGNSDLHIYHSENWRGPYEAHKNNPVKRDEDGSRPAGKIFERNGELFRPAQNCKEYYGKSVSLFKINELNIENYEETPIAEIKADIHKKNKYGLHTINQSGSVIVVDCLKKTFNPSVQIKLFIKKMITRISKK